MHLTKIILSVILLSISLLSFSQTLTEAREMYKSGRYSEAKDIFKSNLAKRPSDPNLNQWYGVCLYMTGGGEQAIPYLNKAAQKKIQDAYLYLGRIYYDKYDFAESKSNFEKYSDAVKKNGADATVAERYLNRAAKALSMLQRTEKVVIIDSISTDKDTFLKMFNLSPESGTLSYYSDEFDDVDSLSSEGTAYKNQRGDKILYTRKTDNSTYSIKERAKMDDGRWSEEIDVPLIERDSASNAYPFLMNDGLTLFYASNNDSMSIGGYDIFVTRKNLNTGQYLVPENRGMPFNSPFNDYMMAIDEINNIGWFVSDRYQKEGRVMIYIFIPNEEKLIYQLTTTEDLISYAKINSISDTWEDNADYSDILKTVHEKRSAVKDTPMSKGKFLFTIIPGVIYSDMSQFKSAKAKEYFKKALDTEVEIARIESDLSLLRNKYLSVRNREEIAAQILKTEEYLASLYRQPDIYRNQSRQVEFEYISQKNK